ncbi:MAG: VanZ family protein [Lachnospiraceae bacterium]|nr:VanZ family protein [Lachnospiraceae bacterium]
MQKPKFESVFIKILFVIYILILLKAVVFKMPYDHMKTLIDSWNLQVIQSGIEHANFTPFRTMDMYIRYWNRGLHSFENLIGNVVIFVPLGFLLPATWKMPGNVFFCMLYGAMAVLGIETFQLLSGFGAFDVDDIILNCVGIFAGYVIYIVISGMNRKYADSGRP